MSVGDARAEDHAVAGLALDGQALGDVDVGFVIYAVVGGDDVPGGRAVDGRLEGREESAQIVMDRRGDDVVGLEPADGRLRVGAVGEPRRDDNNAAARGQVSGSTCVVEWPARAGGAAPPVAGCVNGNGGIIFQAGRGISGDVIVLDDHRRAGERAGIHAHTVIVVVQEIILHLDVAVGTEAVAIVHN